MTTPLSVLDLVPVSAGSGNHTAVRHSVELAQTAERLGYARYWVAEHHLNPGVIGVSPAVTIALVGGATSTIRLGSAGVQLGHRTPLATVEEFGLLDAAFPGRIDLGIGRSPGRPAPDPEGRSGEATSGAVGRFLASRGGKQHDEDQRTENGLLLPRAFDPTTVFSSTRFAHQLELLQQPGAWTPPYAEQIRAVLDLLRDRFESSQGLAAHAHPGVGSDVDVWLLGASGGDSATVAGHHGLPFVASYHHSPSTVVDAVAAYREAFAAADHDHAPYVAVSADVVVAETDDEARVLASGHGPWVLSIRSGQGAIPYPAPADALAQQWTDEERRLVDDRVRTQLVGSPSTVRGLLEQLRDATGADELSITTITHDPAARLRSYELLAREWFGV